MNHDQKYLAQANRHIAELTVQIARQRAIVKDALDTGQRSEMAASLLDALEGSLRIFEKHRIFLLSCSVNRPSNGSHSAPRRRLSGGGPGNVDKRPRHPVLRNRRHRSDHVISRHAREVTGRAACCAASSRAACAASRRERID
jgi:hypothetical protein